MFYLLENFTKVYCKKKKAVWYKEMSMYNFILFVIIRKDS